MKDITDYFKNSTENVNIIKSPIPNTGFSKETCKNGSKVSPATPKSKRVRNKSTPKRKDNTNTKMETENSPELEEAKSQTNTKMETENSLELEDNENSFEIQATSEKPGCDNTKLNAFQFLMMSRNKVIGSNSPGKELPEQEVSNSISPPKLLARKRLLQNWSDSIKSKKRKLNDDDIDKVIKVKLDTRKKRLKSLLNIDDNVAKGAENAEAKIIKPSPKTTEVKILNGNPGNSSKLQLKSNPDETVRKEKVNPKIVGNTLNKSLSSGDDFETKVENNIEISTTKASRNDRIKKNSKGTPKTSTPKSTWRMKIKLVDHDGNKKKDLEDEIICLDDSENSIRDSSENGKKCQNEPNNIESIDTLKKNEEIEENNTCSRILRNRTSLNKNKNIDYVYSSDESDDEKKKKE